MSIPILTALAGLCFVAAMGAGIWLCLHLTSVAHAFEGKADVVTAEKSPRFSLATVITAVAVLIGAASICILIAIAITTGVVHNIVSTS